jgi:hypothetical protein
MGKCGDELCWGGSCRITVSYDVHAAEGTAF